MSGSGFFTGVTELSRSYKKVPVNNGKSRVYKKIAKRVLRRKLKDPEEPHPDGKIWRRYFDSCDICDYAFRCSWEEWLKAEERIAGHEFDEEERKVAYRKWRSWYRGK